MKTHPTQPRMNLPYPINRSSDRSFLTSESRFAELEDSDSARDELNGLEDSTGRGNANFSSLLDYDGYRSIEDCDNGALNSLEFEEETEEQTERPLFLRETPDTGNDIEESPIDPQGFRS